MSVTPGPYVSRPTLVFRAKSMVPPSLFDAVIITSVAMVVSLILFGLFVLCQGINPFEMYSVMFRGAFGSAYAWKNTLIHAAPLMLTALCVALPARVGMIVIGGQGCVILGGLAAALIGYPLRTAPPVVAITAMVVGGAAIGGLWITFCGVLRQYRGVNETISSLLLNYIALAVLNHCIDGPFKDPKVLDRASSFSIGVANMFNPQWGLVIGLVACVFSWIVMDHTTHGFATRIVGGNVRAARVAGLSVPWFSLAACFMGGAAAALTGVIQVVSADGCANASLDNGYGYNGILVAFIARQSPLGIIAVALLMGGLAATGDVLQFQLNLSSASVQVFAGILFLSILGLDTFAGRLKDLAALPVCVIQMVMKRFRRSPVGSLPTGAANV